MKRMFTEAEISAIRNCRNNMSSELKTGIILYDWAAGEECVIINSDNKSLTLAYPDENSMIDQNRIALWNKNNLYEKIANEDSLTFIDQALYDFYINMYSGNKPVYSKAITSESNILPF